MNGKSGDLGCGRDLDLAGPSVGLFSELVARYRAVFFDAYGVLCDSTAVMPGVLAVMRELRVRGVPFWILTNDVSESPGTLAGRYADADGTAVAEDQIVGSGLLLTEYLGSALPGARARPAA